MLYTLFERLQLYCSKFVILSRLLFDHVLQTTRNTNNIGRARNIQDVFLTATLKKEATFSSLDTAIAEFTASPLQIAIAEFRDRYIKQSLATNSSSQQPSNMLNVENQHHPNNNISEVEPNATNNEATCEEDLPNSPMDTSDVTPTPPAELMTSSPVSNTNPPQPTSCRAEVETRQKPNRNTLQKMKKVPYKFRSSA